MHILLYYCQVLAECSKNVEFTNQQEEMQQTTFSTLGAECVENVIGYFQLVLALVAKFFYLF